MSFDEFEAIIKAFNDKEEMLLRESWEQTRILAAIVIQPHIKKRITPRRLIPLPWDKKNQPAEPQISKEQQLGRMKELVKRLGDKL